MQKFLMAPAAALLAACCVVPDATGPAALAEPAAAEAPVAPTLRWRSTGRDTYIYHNVRGDCAFLEHGHGRNNAWGLWRMPLGEAIPGEPSGSEETGYKLAFACPEGRACIQTGQLENTPDRTDTHEIPFQTRADIDTYLADVASLDKACRALK